MSIYMHQDKHPVQFQCWHRNPPIISHLVQSIFKTIQSLVSKETLQTPIAKITIHPRWHEMHLYIRTTYRIEIGMMIYHLTLWRNTTQIGRNPLSPTLNPYINISWSTITGIRIQSCYPLPLQYHRPKAIPPKTPCHCHHLGIHLGIQSL